LKEDAIENISSRILVAYSLKKYGILMNRRLVDSNPIRSFNSWNVVWTTACLRRYVVNMSETTRTALRKLLRLPFESL
jgi:hypothetical protein